MSRVATVVFGLLFPLLSYGNCAKLEYQELKDMSKKDLTDQYCYTMSLGDIQQDKVLGYIRLTNDADKVGEGPRVREKVRTAERERDECYDQAGKAFRALKAKYKVVKEPDCTHWGKSAR